VPPPPIRPAGPARPSPVQLKPAFAAPDRSYPPPPCCPSNAPSGRTLQRAQSFKPAWDAKENTKSGFKTNDFISVEIDGEWVGLGTVSNYTKIGAHAEDQAIALLNQNLAMLPADCRVLMHLTSSPCTSTVRKDADGDDLPVTGKGCAETLVGYFGTGVTHADSSGGQHRLRLVLTCTGLYAPQIADFKQAQVLEASQAAVDYLGLNGIEVSGNCRPRVARRFQIA